MRSLVTTKYGLPWQQAFKACLGREWRLFYRNSFAFYSSTFQVSFLLFGNGGLWLLSMMGASRLKLRTLVQATFRKAICVECSSLEQFIGLTSSRMLLQYCIPL